jgi:hypothetical protein
MCLQFFVKLSNTKFAKLLDLHADRQNRQGEANRHTFTTSLKCCSYLTVNTLRLQYKDQPVNTAYIILAVYSKDRIKHLTTLNGQNVYISFKIHGNTTDITSAVYDTHHRG